MKVTLRIGAMLAVLPFLGVQAATVAIIDSGTDMKHVEISPKAWVNPGETADDGIDNDGNQHVDDIHGWNFAENNNQVIDYQYLNRLNEDVRKFFDIQSKMLLGTASAEELAWLDSKKSDVQFARNLSVYGNFMHGTHVAGIAAKGAAQAKVLAIKLIPTEVKLPFPPGELEKMLDGPDPRDLLVIAAMKAGLSKLAGEQMKILRNIAGYIHTHKVDVANGSFGTGHAQAQQVVKALFKLLAGRGPNEAETHELSAHFVNNMIKEGTSMVASAPNTLFVFAAGNDGTDNDKFPCSPAGVRANNSISVAASTYYGEIAAFSNFGAQSVDVVAPGVAVSSAVPGNEYMKVSGTSQAAPYVSRVAAQVKDANPNLSPADIKTIIMKTVDVRPEWAGRVKSSGMVNGQRAVRAAQFTVGMSVARAIQAARSEVRDHPRDTNKAAEGVKFTPGLVLPLPSPFMIDGGQI